ncbi:MAG: HNH endonuclease signature motif containing protein [Acidimicrobiales bacterium]
MLTATTCFWPGCTQPVHRCEADHLQPWQSGGSTSPGNGAPACGKHNRWRNHGYTVQRDPAGNLHIHRPDGTEIT